MDFDDEKSSYDVIDNVTMSDDEVVASYGPPRSLFGNNLGWMVAVVDTVFLVFIGDVVGIDVIIYVVFVNVVVVSIKGKREIREGREKDRDEEACQK